MGLFDQLRTKVCQDASVTGVSNNSFCETRNAIGRYIEPVQEEMQHMMDEGMSGADITNEFSPSGKGKVIQEFFDGTANARMAAQKVKDESNDKKKKKKGKTDGKPGNQDGDEPGEGAGNEAGTGLGERLLYPLFRDPITKKKLVEALKEYRTSPAYVAPEQTRRGKNLNYRRTFQSSLKAGGMDIRWVYNTYPPQKKEDIVWLADVSGSMATTFVFLSPVVDALRELGLKQRFFMGDTGDSFVEVPEGAPFGSMLEKIGSGGTDIGKGIENTRKSIKTFKDKTLILYTDTDMLNDTGTKKFTDEIVKVTKEGGKVLILNPMPKRDEYNWSGNRKVKEYDDVPGMEHINGFVNVLKDAKSFVTNRR